MYEPNLMSVALPVPEIIAIEYLGPTASPSFLGRGGRRGSGMASFERASANGEFLLALHSNFSSIFTRFRDIAAFVLQRAIFPTPPLVSLKFPHVPLGVGWATESDGACHCLANCLCNQSPRFPAYVLLIHKRY